MLETGNCRKNWYCQIHLFQKFLNSSIYPFRILPLVRYFFQNGMLPKPLAWVGTSLNVFVRTRSVRIAKLFTGEQTELPAKLIWFVGYVVGGG